MVRRQFFRNIFYAAVFTLVSFAVAEQAGGIRGIIRDKEFESPLSDVIVLISETGEKTASNADGNFVLGQVAPGTYTLVFSREGYTRVLKADVLVSAGRMAELDIMLSGEFTEMDEFIVQDLQLGSGTEAALLDLRMESPALMDSVSAELMSRAGAGDAASALKLVSGATVQDGKYAVIRGLPDRYVNSQMNAVRLPTADTDKRAVQLDQFPSAAIESIQVSKTFTPDQQGDASGGAVNVVLKGIPEETVLNFSTAISFNTEVRGSDFLSYKGGGVNFWGKDSRDIPLNGDFDEGVGVSSGDAPTDYKWSVSGGGKHQIDDRFKIGGLGSFFYERDSSFIENGIDNSFWVEKPGAPMTPQYGQGSPEQGDFKTSLFDVTQSSEQVQWGGLGSLGFEAEDEHWLSLTYMYTRVAEDEVTLAEDTAGKSSLHKYWPDLYGPEYDNYDRNDPTHPANQIADAAPYLRYETLQYTERTTQTLQLSGRHKLPDIDFPEWDNLTLLTPELDWGISRSMATLDQPDKRQFGSMWWPASYNPGYMPWVPPFTTDEEHRPLKPAANFTMGNLQRIWKDISEQSNQYYLNIKFPFEQWTQDEGYLKFGFFSDKVKRDYNQDSFSNFNDNDAQYYGTWEDFWSSRFFDEGHPMTAADIDVDYKGMQDIIAWYNMIDLPLCSSFNVIGGARFETTELSIVNDAEKDVTWIPPGATGPVKLNPGDADVSFEQDDILPSIGFEYKPWEPVSLRGNYSETIARQTFKELSPIQQQEFLGGDVFIGNPDLRMSDLKNYDLRVDFTPYEGGLLSASYFYKDVKNPIEYVQKNAGFTYTTPMNYPKGTLDGYELEIRQKMGRFYKEFEGLTLGANATFINSTVTLPDDEAAQFDDPKIMAPMSERDMTNAPEHLYNLFMTYDIEATRTQLALFYTVRGDTLVAGAGQSNGKFVPSIYETEFGTLNLSLSQKLGKIWKCSFQWKNILDPEIESVYRSEYIDSDVTRSSYRKGMEFSIGFSAEF